jgi:beta-lactamase superfamily II metal-dependent hydrolase
MDVSTIYVGQGALAVVRHAGEAIIVDSHVENADDDTLRVLQSTLGRLLKGYVVRGLVLTGFDADHAHPDGVDLILTDFEPDWVMYPTYFKDTDSATNVFRVIDKHVKKRQQGGNPLEKLSVRVDKVDDRELHGLAASFTFELFSPHIEDMDNSNNCSIVLKMSGIGHGGFSYLVTGDTENARWERINALFGDSLAAHVLAAPHHGSKNAANAETILLVSPNTVLVSAGVDNQYGHPDPQAIAAYQRVATHVYSTHKLGASLFTKPAGVDFLTEHWKN